MASSDFDTYGQLHCKNLFLDESGIKFHDPNDDTKTATLKVSGLGAGNVDLQLPTSAGTLLTTSDSVNLQPGDIDNANLFAANVVDASALAPNAVVDANVAAGAAIAKSKLAALNIADADVAAGAAIAKSKLAALEIADADVAAGAAIAKSKLAALEVANADVAAGAAIAGSKVAPDFGAQKVETTGDVEAGSAAAFYLGDSGTDGSWRMRRVNNDIVWERRETGSYVQKHLIAP
jgi:hypothetical protein